MSSLEDAQCGDVVTLGDMVPQEHRGRRAVITKIAESHCTVAVLDESLKIVIGDCWPAYCDVYDESTLLRLGNRIVISGLKGVNSIHLNGLTGTITEHPCEGHPCLIRKTACPEKPLLAVCVRYDDAKAAGKRSQLLEARFLKSYGETIDNKATKKEKNEVPKGEDQAKKENSKAKSAEKNGEKKKKHAEEKDAQKEKKDEKSVKNERTNYKDDKKGNESEKKDEKKDSKKVVNKGGEKDEKKTDEKDTKKQDGQKNDKIDAKKDADEVCRMAGEALRAEVERVVEEARRIAAEEAMRSEVERRVEDARVDAVRRPEALKTMSWYQEIFSDALESFTQSQEDRRHDPALQEWFGKYCNLTFGEMRSQYIHVGRDNARYQLTDYELQVHWASLVAAEARRPLTWTETLLHLF